MSKKRTSKRLGRKRSTVAQGVDFEKVVARIQQMMDSASTVSHNVVLEDRIGNRRQYDVVIRGQFGGRPVIGVMECKDHGRKKGPDAVEAFAKKTENLGANLRVMVSRKGFTEQALRLARHENIGCISLLPNGTEQAGFSIGAMWYGVIAQWTTARLVVDFAATPAPIATYDGKSVKYDGRPVINWFLRELFTTYQEITQEGEYSIVLTFDKPAVIEVEGVDYPVAGITCVATRVYRRKRKWVTWSGDAFYDWHTRQLTIPAEGKLVGSAVETDLTTWPDFDGVIPSAEGAGFMQGVLVQTQKWDPSQDETVPDLNDL